MVNFQNLQQKLILGLIVILIAMVCFSETMPLLTSSAQKLENINAPLSSAFDLNGVVIIIVMLSFAIFIIRRVMIEEKGSGSR